jgi:hypothetical protein
VPVVIEVTGLKDGDVTKEENGSNVGGVPVVVRHNERPHALRRSVGRNVVSDYLPSITNQVRFQCRYREFLLEHAD